MRQTMMLIYVRVPVSREELKAQFSKFPEEAFPAAIKKLLLKGLIKIEDDKLV